MHELVPGGEGKELTKENRKLFVERYLHWILVESIEKQFKAFRWVGLSSGRAAWPNVLRAAAVWPVVTPLRDSGCLRAGFESVVEGSHVLGLLQTSELRELICGQQELDFEELEKVRARPPRGVMHVLAEANALTQSAVRQVAKYDGGYSAETPVVRWFWEAVHSMTGTHGGCGGRFVLLRCGPTSAHTRHPTCCGSRGEAQASPVYHRHRPRAGGRPRQAQVYCCQAGRRFRPPPHQPHVFQRPAAAPGVLLEEGVGVGG